ncbi:MAG: 5-formyltetrahydrofolate cyclo-ligase [Bacillota bacterium]
MKKQKKELRKKVISERDQLTKKDLAEKSRHIADNLFSLPAYHHANTIMYFISFGTEVDTRPMVEETIRQGKVALAPKPRPQERIMIPSRILDWDRDLVTGAYNIPEPKEEALRPYHPWEIDLLIVPGVAFDLKGNRLGYGGGYYDRFFELLKKDTPLVALVFELQVVPEVPVEEWDRRVDLIITEKRIINPGENI